MVVRCNSSDQQSGLTYHFNTGYTPDQVAKLTVDYQVHVTQPDTPNYIFLLYEGAVNGPDYAEMYAGPSDTTDEWITWSTTAAATYMSNSGEVLITACGCPQNSNMYDTYLDVVRLRLELVGSPPAADFSGSPTSGTAPLTVNFTDQSTNSPTSWSWDFGDSGTSTAQNPSHEYTSAGDYTVSLTASNAVGSDTATKTDYISVTVPAPVADFTGSPTSGTAPLTVDFTDQSTNSPTSWSWDFGDSSTSTAQNPSHEYTAAGTYTVSLTATNAGGSDTATKTDYITATSGPAEEIVYPDEWETYSGQDVTVISGSLADLDADDDVYLVAECNSSNQQSSFEFRWHTNYTAADISKITVEFQYHGSSSSTPQYWTYIKEGDLSQYTTMQDFALWPTTDQWSTWETTNVSQFLASDGSLTAVLCACPQSSSTYNTYLDVVRIRLELAQ